MNPPLQTYSDVFNPKNPLTSLPVRGRIVTLPLAVIALILAISLVCGCAKENEDFAKLQEENRVLKEKIASLESQIKPGIALKPEIRKNLLPWRGS